jgi:tRNA pseudouridine55 synthase
MDATLLLNKPLGVTPLELIQAYVKVHPEYQGVKLGYAGRLDPMAEGLVLILVGEENKQREKYLGLDKEYEIEVLFGISTDTYDVLGLVTGIRGYDLSLAESRIPELVAHFQGTYDQAYPPYSSKAVQGKPLYWWAREGKLSSIIIPTASRTVQSIVHLENRFIDTDDLVGDVWEKIATIQTGDFRKPAIIDSWKSWHASKDSTSQNPFLIASFRITASSGTYMRSIAHDMGRHIGLPALAFSIKRTRIGDYTLSNISS